ncbi:MAG: cytochrome b/b6 domain-containing protein [Alphaproteobacteria bacterium]|nr:cytochrome b/b6 domain-containing protein [Alphaproteobacteria bacterium]
MAVFNTTERFGAVAKLLHWATALAVLTMFPLAWWMDDLPLGLAKLQAYNWHKSIGVTILAVAVIRLIWRLNNPRPRYLGTPGWQQWTATAVHALLYLCLLTMPLLGWLGSAAANTPVNVFGLIILPQPIAPDRILAEVFEEAHETVATLLMVLVALHVAGALKHHLVDRDDTLRRMLPAVAVGLMVGFLSLDAQAEPSSWTVRTEESRITFIATQLGAPIEGVFHRFESDIRFDPGDLAGSSAAVTIETASLDTGEDNRDKAAKGPDFFDAASHPIARFETRAITGRDGGGYVAEGTLTIKNAAKPIALPFELDIADGVARMRASITVKRLDFALGTGEWATNGAVGETVEIRLTVTADRKP